VSQFVVIATFAYKKDHGREPLMDYFQKHVITLKEYLRIMRQKVMDREATKQIRKSKKKER
jgi:hypothetical protein